MRPLLAVWPPSQPFLHRRSDIWWSSLQKEHLGAAAGQWGRRGPTHSTGCRKRLVGPPRRARPRDGGPLGGPCLQRRAAAASPKTARTTDERRGLRSRTRAPPSHLASEGTWAPSFPASSPPRSSCKPPLPPLALHAYPKRTVTSTLQFPYIMVARSCRDGECARLMVL